MQKTSSLAKWGVAVLLLSSLSSCEDILEQYFPKPTPPPTTPTFPNLGLDIPFYALGSGNRLDAYSTQNPSSRTSSVAISGLGSGETLLAIDFRPATGQLYGVSSASRLYVINQNTGMARAIGAEAFSPAVAGNLVGFDFNPTVDRIRLVTSTGQNLRLNPETGTVAATDGSLNGVAGAQVTGAAYTNNTAGASTTVLYDLDPTTDQLYRQDPPNDGKLVAVGSLNLAISGNGGFDIDAKTSTALGLYSVNGNPTLFAINLSTGAAQPLAQYAASAQYSGIAIPTQPVAYATTANSLYIFDLNAPTAGITKSITGLAPGQNITGIDFRPANGQLYALARNDEFTNVALYTINTATAAATLVGPLSGGVALRVGNAGFDFDPVADRIRVIAGRRNVRVNPTDATFIEDNNMCSENCPSSGVFDDLIAAAAYDNNYAGATTSTLYAIIPRRARSVVVPRPNEGYYVPGDAIIAPGDLQYENGFDIGGMSNKGYAILSSGQFNIGNFLYTLDLPSFRYTQRVEFPFEATGFTVGLGF